MVVIVFPPNPEALPAECDWGYCDEPAVTWRFSLDDGVWLPVCEAHSDDTEDCDQTMTPTPSPSCVPATGEAVGAEGGRDG